MSLSENLPFKLNPMAIALFAVAVVAVILIVRKLPLVPASVKP